MSIINIPESKIKINKKFSKEYLESKPELRNALYADASKRATQKRKEVVYKEKSILKQKYWALDNYIKLFGQNPWINSVSCYWSFFLNDIWGTEDTNHKSILSDLEIIIGKLNSLTQKEINEIITGNLWKNYWKIWNPIYWIMLWLQWLWWHKVISIIVCFIIWAIFTAIITDSIKPITELLSKPAANSLSWLISK